MALKGEVKSGGRAGQKPGNTFIATVHSDQLLAGCREIAIEHGGRIYWLCHASGGRLILRA